MNNDKKQKGELIDPVNTQDLTGYLVEAEQIPEEGESADDFMKRTKWTLEKENYWRKVNGMPLLKSEQEYRNLLEDKLKDE
ncbi:MAG: hypothetical protein PHP25_00980 [Candidatus Moranbacteria bacterium]|nr:hypothetical protein [Candidatus Moranbacteria bacterium]